MRGSFNLPFAGTALLIGVGSAQVGAQDNVVRIDPVVVSASRIPLALSEAPGGTTVIDREQIDARRPLDVVELLRQVPGLHIDQPGGRGSVSSVYTRGSEPNFTLVMIDGVRVNDPTNSRGGSFDFSTLDLESVERIEVVRGALSSLYGSDAMGGVINVITREPTAQRKASIVGEVGVDGYRRAGATVSGGAATALDYAISGSWVDNGTPVTGSEFIGRSVNGRLGWLASDDISLRFVSRYADSDAKSFPDDSGGPEFAVLRSVDNRDMQEFTAGLTLEHELSDWAGYTLAATVYDRNETVDSPGVAPGARHSFGIPANSADNDFRRYDFTASTELTLAKALQSTVGVEYQFEDGTSRTTLEPAPGITVPGRFELDRGIFAAFGELRYATRFGLTLQGGLRFDSPEGFDDELSPSVGALYEIDSTGTSIKASWGEGFKLPSFFALGNPIVGNRSLVPETSEGFDVGVFQKLWGDRVEASATFFHNRFSNLVDLDEGPPLLLVNRSKVTTQGVELGLELQPAQHVSFNGHVTYTDTDIEGTDEKLRNRPDWRAGINARWLPRADLITNVAFLYVGESPDSSIPTGDRDLDSYSRVDISATWTPRPELRVSVAVDNLFDTDYEEAIGFPAPGIRPRLSLQVTF